MPNDALAPFANQRYLNLESFKRDGTPVLRRAAGDDLGGPFFGCVIVGVAFLTGEGGNGCQ